MAYCAVRSHPSPPPNRPTTSLTSATVKAPTGIATIAGCSGWPAIAARLRMVPSSCPTPPRHAAGELSPIRSSTRRHGAPATQRGAHPAAQAGAHRLGRRLPQHVKRPVLLDHARVRPAVLVAPEAQRRPGAADAQAAQL